MEFDNIKLKEILNGINQNIMNKKKVNKVLRLVQSGNPVKFNDLRSTASAVGIKTKAGVTSDDLIDKLKSHIVVKGIGPGRPMVGPNCPIVGYKVKVGLRYPTDTGELTTSMKEGKLFKSKDECQEAVNNLLQEGKVRVWGPEKTVRAHFLPRYGSPE